MVTGLVGEKGLRGVMICDTPHSATAGWVRRCAGEADAAEHAAPSGLSAAHLSTHPVLHPVQDSMELQEPVVALDNLQSGECSCPWPWTTPWPAAMPPSNQRRCPAAVLHRRGAAAPAGGRHCNCSRGAALFFAPALQRCQLFRTPLFFLFFCTQAFSATPLARYLAHPGHERAFMEALLAQMRSE